MATKRAVQAAKAAVGMGMGGMNVLFQVSAGS
jgi:hypothetical protein